MKSTSAAAPRRGSRDAPPGPRGRSAALEPRGPPTSNARAPHAAGGPATLPQPGGRLYFEHAAPLRTSSERNLVYFSARPALNSLGSRAAQVPSALAPARSSCRWVAPARTTMIAPEEGVQVCRGVPSCAEVCRAVQGWMCAAVRRHGGAAVQRSGEVQRGGQRTSRAEHAAELIPRRGREAAEDNVKGAVGKGQAVPGR